MEIKNVVSAGLMSLMISMSLAANDTIFNRTDAEGRKQGYWRKTRENGTPVYFGFFKNDHPVGRFVRYYDDGSLQSVLFFDSAGIKAHARIYYTNGNLSAEGVYVHRKKDSTWKYYSYYTRALKAEENYRMDVKHGLSVIYFDNGKVSERKYYVNGKKQGPWEQFYEDGGKRASCNFDNNTFHGEYITWYPHGQVFLQGNYEKGIKQGKWRYYDEKGTLKSEIEYVNGIPVNLDELEADELKFFQQLEQMKGKIPEPSENDFLKQPGEGQ